VPPPVQRVLTLSSSADPKAAAPVEPTLAEEQSGVRHLLLRNEPGVLREVCSPIVYQRCS